jgi:ribonuclease-3
MTRGPCRPAARDRLDHRLSPDSPGSIELGRYLLLGEGESQRSGRRRPSLLASSFEALTGALYLDLGYDVVRRWLQTLAEPELSLEAPVLSLKSPKVAPAGIHAAPIG